LGTKFKKGPPGKLLKRAMEVRGERRRFERETCKKRKKKTQKKILYASYGEKKVLNIPEGDGK